MVFQREKVKRQGWPFALSLWSLGRPVSFRNLNLPNPLLNYQVLLTATEGWMQFRWCTSTARRSHNESFR